MRDRSHHRSSQSLAGTKTKVFATRRLEEVTDSLREALLAKGINTSVQSGPAAGSTGSKVRLPLHFFDNLDLERHDGPEWAEICECSGRGPNAVLLLPDPEGDGEKHAWMLGRVTGWDAKSSCFSAQRVDSSGRPFEDTSFMLPRLSVMFLEEPLHFYVKNMPTDDVRTLNELQINRLLERTLTTEKLRNSELDASALIDEVRLEYAQTINAMLLREGLQRPPLRDKVRADLLLPPPPPPVPESGVIQIPDNNAIDAKASFLAISPLVMPQVVRALAATRHECIQLSRLSLLNTELMRTLALDEFETLQSQHTVRLLQFLRESWQPAIKKVVSDSMRGVDEHLWEAYPPAPSIYVDVFEEDAPPPPPEDEVELQTITVPRPDNRMMRLMTNINLMMCDSIRQLSSISAYVAFLSGHCEKTDVTTDPMGHPYVPLFSLELVANGAQLEYSTRPESFVDVTVRLLDDALTAVDELLELDVFDLAITMNLYLHPLRAISASEPEIVEQREELKKAVAQSIGPLYDYVGSLTKHEELLSRDEAEYVKEFSHNGGKEPPSLQQIRDKAEEERRLREALDAELPDDVLIGMFMVSLSAFKSALLSKHERTAQLLLQLISDRARAACNEISTAFAEMYEKLQEQPKDIEKLTEIQESVQGMRARTVELQEQIQHMTEHYEVLEALYFEVPKEDFSQRWESFHWPLRLKLKQEESEKMLQEDRQLFQKEMIAQQQQFEKHLEELAYRVANFHQYTDPSRITKVVSIVHDIQQALKDYEAKALVFNKRESLFDEPPTEYDQLQKIVKDFEPYASLWLTANDWQKWQREWLDGSLNALIPEEVEKNFTNATRTIAKSVKTFKDLPGCLSIAKQLKEEMQSFAPSLPVVNALRNAGMRERHWDALSADLKFELRPDDRFTLRDATEGLRLHEPKTLERVQKVCDRAMKEYAIEKALNDMQAGWKELEFETFPYRSTGTCVIKMSDEVNTLLDDHIVLTQQFSFSPYKGPFEERISVWERKLRLTQEVTSEWLGCQRNWMYLQPIFDSDDINRQLPTEGKRFSGVDRLWRKTIERVKKAPHLMTFCDDEDLLEQWIKANSELERVQKNLADYLETKRAAFARFYFLSNDELISILSQTKDPNAVQPHLRKCFEAIHGITMKGPECEMSSMTSPEKESIDFLHSLYPKGSVEVWMGEIETMMRRSVRHVTELAIHAYPKTKRGQFVLEHAAMVVLAVTQYCWTMEVEESLGREGVEGVEKYYEKMIGQLKELSELVRTQLTKLQSKVLSALIVMEVHARDVVERLLGAKVGAATDFEWVSQLRYYWEEQETYLGPTNLLLRMVQATYPYGYEYLGASSRLVVTPLTDRCYMTLMGAMHIKLGGAPAGPAGTGKTESVKDLAKALAKQCVVFNCSDGLDYKAMGKFFKGLSTAGAWACFDEFNRIDIEVLSVIAQQMLTIQAAIIGNKEVFEFEGTMVKLDMYTATFITMNPGYAGRTELPDNLKALFRPMAMMVPDYALIAEIRLFSFGFDKSKPLAEKLVSTFRLSSEQLSSQDHYDFGMRAVNTVIQAAGILKKSEPGMQEDLQMLRAMRDSNLPKFLRDDILLFRAIIKDLFPGVVEPVAVYEGLERELALVIEEHGLQAAEDFKIKCIQLHEMTVVRHGMMLVGPTGGGKTRVLRALQGAVSRVKMPNGAFEPGFEYVRVYRCNPKSVTMNQLYGSFDLQTGEWTDGVAAVLIRHISQPNTEETGVTGDNIKWMVFDGPVDAIWIENMNTVLDDNKKLCLNSGEIVPLSETNRIMFEVEDLAVASPATVSRCGMIYVEPAYLLPDRLDPNNASEKPLCKSWIQQLKPPFRSQMNAFKKLIDTYLVPASELLRLELPQAVAVTMPNAVAGLFRLLDCYMLPFLPAAGAEPDPEKEQAIAEQVPAFIEPMFMMALIWSIGGTTTYSGRTIFDQFLRSKIKDAQSNVSIPAQGLVYDFVFDFKTGEWKRWLTTIPAYTDFSSIIVPTGSTVCYTSLLDTLLKGNKHTIIVGETGVGKSVVVQQKLTLAMDAKYEPIMMAFSAQTSANQTQDILDNKFEKRRQGLDKNTGLQFTMWGPMLGKQFVVFLDDFNMPKRETYGAQPPVELMRQMVDHGGWYDRKTFRIKRVVDVTLLGAMGPPGGGRQPMTNRMLRHMHMIAFTDMSSSEIEGIFNTITTAFLRTTFSEELVPLALPLVKATIGVYSITCDSLRPTPAKPHYTFNLREVSKVVQGVLMADKRRAKEQFTTFQIEITKNYRQLEWREDLKTVLKLAGVQLRPVVFLFVDTQITEEVFLENVNNILSAGEVPNLFDDTDMGIIFEKMTPLVVSAQWPVNKTNLYSMFIKMIKRNMHVVMCMSPLGEEYRNRIRQFPSLINCCTIDWFSPWPPEALTAVARTLMSVEAETIPEQLFDGMVSMCKKMHVSVRDKSTQYAEEMRRYNYVTPTSFLELINMIKMVLSKRQTSLTEKRSRLTVGLDKLNSTKQIVSTLKQQLAEQQPILEATAIQVKEQQIQIAADQEEAKVVKAEAETSAAAANAKAAECKEIKDTAEAGLAEALPALDAAVKCLSKLDKSQIVEVKALKKPPAGVRLTLKAICIMFQVKAVKIQDPENPQKKIDDFWGPSQKLLNDLGPDKFKQELIDFDKDNIPESAVKQVDPICDSEEFQPEVIVKVSVACEAMCMWVHAMRKYYYVSLEVEPLRLKLADAMKELETANASKAAAESKLDAVTNKVAALEAALQEAVDKMASLEEQVARASVQLSNADKLISGLGGEAKSWEDQVVVLTEQLNNVMGDVLLCAATISYLGPFVASYRNALVVDWLAKMTEMEIPHTAHCSLSKILAEPVLVRQWNIDGLPADAFSVENGIIMSSTKRWPLMIDPQGQANRFVKASGVKQQLKFVKASDSTKKIQQMLEMGIRLGQPVLLENVVEQLDPFLDPVLANQTYKDANGSLVIKLGDSVIPYHDDFRFSLTTVIPNPHYAPEVSVKVCLLNFTITPDGLQDQLLVSTVETERADLAEKKNQLVIQSADNKRKLQEIQDEILYMLSHSEGDILDDTKLIDTLAVSKVTSEEIMEAVSEAEVAEREIDELSSKYIPVAARGSILFFAIADLSLVDPMYQYSLSWFKNLFVQGIINAPKSADLDERIASLNDFITYSLYCNICRSIFEAHKLMFSFLLAIKILMGQGKIDLQNWRFLLSGGALPSGMKKPDAEWVTQSIWIEVINLAALPAFAGIDQHIYDNVDQWKALYDSPTPELDQLPEPYESKCSRLQRLCVLRCLRPDKCVPGIQLFVEAEMGRRFIEPPPFDLQAAYKDASVSLPLIFILSSGADPVKGLLAYAEQTGMADRLEYISLGQGQGPKAEKMIADGKQNGKWVLLMNCHLYVSWMPTLEKEVEDTDPAKTDPSFRLWLTSMPSNKFPVSVLQNGVKMTNEPPKGLRANLRTAIAATPEERFEATNKPDAWRKVMFGLLLFNAVILERRKFGALGWNIAYEFTDGDRDVCIQQAEMLVNDYEVIPYKVISALTSDVNYGGRVTDSWDRRLIAAQLKDFVNPRVLEVDYHFSSSGQYRSIAATDKQGYLDYLEALPVNAFPEVFGLHDNADITCAQKDTFTMFATILSLQPRTATGAGNSRDEVLDEMASDILDKLPEPFNLEAITDKFPTVYEESMNTVLQQESTRYNKVIVRLLTSLKDVRKALKGEVVMTAELELMGNQLYVNQIPDMWAKVAYPSLKPLATWVPDLLARISFIQTWFAEGKPQVFWISGFYFPQAFITGVMQNHARKYQVPIDTVTYDYKIRDDLEVEGSAHVEDGALVHGLFLEGARWDSEVHLLQESRPKELYTALPIIHLLPCANRKLPEDGFYLCPIYKTLSRFGVLSTTGHSTNFVMTIEIPSDKEQSHWIKRGVAGIAALNF
ncbi:hypothetical protein AB1Y20_006588 [Prymnesium parvum]|uniref:Dynein heavy chain n=1 Tax=Prymnesium parvum TaxID=97485 RepID=A0AB34J140_PRYPA